MACWVLLGVFGTWCDIYGGLTTMLARWCLALHMVVGAEPYGTTFVSCFGAGPGIAHSLMCEHTRGAQLGPAVCHGRS